MSTKSKIFKIIDIDEVFDMPPPLEDPERRLKIYFSKKNMHINNKLYQVIYSIEEHY